MRLPAPKTNHLLAYKFFKVSGWQSFERQFKNPLFILGEEENFYYYLKYPKWYYDCKPFWVYCHINRLEIVKSPYNENKRGYSSFQEADLLDIIKIMNKSK